MGPGGGTATGTTAHGCTGGRADVVGVAGGNAHWRVSNYSTDKINALLQRIRRVLPIGNGQWELVAELHGLQHGHNANTVESIRRMFYSMKNQQTGTGDLTLPPMIALSKQIREAINVKDRVTDAEVSDFFDKVEGEETEAEPTNVVVEEEEEEAARAEQSTHLLPTIVTTTECRKSSVGSSGNLTTSVAKIKDTKLVEFIKTLSCFLKTISALLVN